MKEKFLRLALAVLGLALLSILPGLGSILPNGLKWG